MKKVSKLLLIVALVIAGGLVGGLSVQAADNNKTTTVVSETACKKAGGKVKDKKCANTKGKKTYNGYTIITYKNVSSSVCKGGGKKAKVKNGVCSGGIYSGLKVVTSVSKQVCKKSGGKVSGAKCAGNTRFNGAYAVVAVVNNKDSGITTCKKTEKKEYTKKNGKKATKKVCSKGTYKGATVKSSISAATCKKYGGKVKSKVEVVGKTKKTTKTCKGGVYGGIVLNESKKQIASASVYGDDSVSATGSASGAMAISKKDSLTGTIQRIVNALMGIAGIVAVVVIIVGGINMATSQGDAAKVKKGRNTLLYGILGLLVALLAFAIINFAISFIRIKE